jgi:hypothetical protein
MTNHTPLSLAAQAVKDHFLANVPISLEHGLAAALRAAADRAESLIGDIEHPKFIEGILAASYFLEHTSSELEALADGRQIHG